MRNNKKRGFTLVELLVVIAILAILATVSVVGYTSFIQRASISNDENVAAQLNKFLVAVKADSTGPFYNEEITEDNVGRLNEYILQDSSLGELIPQSEKYGYHFYYDLENHEYVLLHEDKANDKTPGAMHFMLWARGAGVEPNSLIPETCFSVLGANGKPRYYLVETGSDLANVVKGFYTVSRPDGENGLKALYDNAKGLGAGFEKLVALLEKSVFVTSNGYLTVTDAGHKALFVPEDLTGINLSGVKLNVLTNTPNAIDSSSNPLINLSADSKFYINNPTLIYSNALVFAGDHYTPDAEGNYKTTLVFPNLTAEELAQKVDVNFTNVVFELSDGKQYGYKNGEIVCLEDGSTAGEVTSKLSVSSFSIGIQGIDSEGRYSVALDKAATTYQMVASNFVSSDPINPNYVPDTSVTWSLIDAPAGVEIDANTGVISGIKAGTIVVKAASVMTPATTAQYEIRVGEVNGAVVSYTFNGASTTVAFDGNNNYTSETIYHAYGANNVYEFNVTALNSLADVYNYDTSYTWTVSDPSLAEMSGDTLTIKKAGTFSVTLSFDKYPAIKRTVVFDVSNTVTSFGIGIDGIETNNSIYSVDLAAKAEYYQMIITSVGTNDGGNSLLNKTPTWSVLGDGATITADGKLSFTKGGTFTVKATIDNVTSEFAVRVGYVSGMTVQYTNGGLTTTVIFDTSTYESEVINHSLGINDT